MRKIQSSYTKFKDKFIEFMGDSITQNYAYNIQIHHYFPTVLQDKLNALGCNMLSRNFGISGNTTTQMLARFSAMLQFGTPQIAVIYGGINDGTAYETITNNLKTMATTMLNAGSKVIICLVHYNNYTADGSATELPEGATLLLHNAQKQAYTDLSALYPGDIAYCDFYAYMRNLIDTGVVAQGDWSAWNVADKNVHLNANGQNVLADALLATIQAQTGWITLLK